MVDATCKALGDRLIFWEVGNEPDLLPNWGQRTSSNWTVAEFVEQWKDYASRVIDQAKASCGDDYDRPFYGPSIASANNDPDAFTNVAAFAAGINNVSKTPIAQIPSHSYMGLGGSANLGQLMSHNKVKYAIAKHLRLQDDLAKYELPFSVGEGNSLTGGGQEGVSDVFGAALWAADYSLYIATKANRITRSHFHQSYGAERGSPYNAWKPISDDLGDATTQPSYYGHLMAAKAVGSEHDGKIIEVALPKTDGLDSMYVTYDASGPKRIAVLNMKQWHGHGHRNVRKYTVKLPAGRNWDATVERLQASSATAKTGVTFGGNSYDYDSHGKAQAASEFAQKASAAGVTINGDTLSIEVPDTEGALVTLHERSNYASESSPSGSNADSQETRALNTYGWDKYKCLPVHAPRSDDIPFGWIDCSRKT